MTFLESAATDSTPSAGAWAAGRPRRYAAHSISDANVSTEISVENVACCRMEIGTVHFLWDPTMPRGCLLRRVPAHIPMHLATGNDIQVPQASATDEHSCSICIVSARSLPCKLSTTSAVLEIERVVPYGVESSTMCVGSVDIILSLSPSFLCAPFQRNKLHTNLENEKQ